MKHKWIHVTLVVVLVKVVVDCVVVEEISAHRCEFGGGLQPNFAAFCLTEGIDFESLERTSGH